jgi:hypothetical protein
MGFALAFACVLHQVRRDWRTARETSEALLALTTEQRIPFWIAPAHIFHGWALAGTGEPEVDVAEASAGAAGFRATGSEGYAPLLLAAQAAAQREAAQPAQASLAVLDEGVAVANKTGSAGTRPSCTAQGRMSIVPRHPG